MKRLFVVVILSLMSFNLAFTQDEPVTGINFEHISWNKILIKAKKENKYIFLDAFASWCGPCKWMAKNVFTENQAASFYNKNFINAKIDMEKGEGIDLAKKYGVMNYPTFLYINGNGEVVHRICGSMPLEDFIQNGKNALNPEKQLLSLKKKFEKNSSDPVLALNYFILLENGCANMDKAVSSYLKTQKESDLKSKTNWSIINRFLNDYNSREFNYLVKHKNEFARLYTKDSVDRKIVFVYENSLRNLIRNKDTDGYASLKAKITKSGDSNAEKIILSSDLIFYQKNKDWQNYVKTAEPLITKYGNNDYALLNQAAWTFFENIDDKSLLLKAEKWAKKSVQLNNQYFNNDTYAWVLFKLGKYSEAEKTARLAIELAKKEGADYSETEKLLKKLKDS